MWNLLVILAAFSGAAQGEWSVRADAFSLGPVGATLDLRTMVTNHLVRESCRALEQTAARREEAFKSGTWQAWRDRVREQVRVALGDLPFAAAGGPLNVRPVSRHERSGYAVENVLFESLPGMDVNASLFLPDPAAYPPPWPAVVVSVGHSTKTGDNYQKPAQVFARCGYAALLYDPPGVSGEKQAGNDHFTDGVRCYATGISSNRYFVIDGLRAVDYLASRPDMDLSRGVAATGVSGGGVTTMFMTLLDERITVSGPSCCATPKAVHPVLDTYAECPEVLSFNRFHAYDDIDLLAAAMPAAVMLMAGKEDEVFTEPMTRAIAESVASKFEAARKAERFSLFLDDSGHAYTTRMALQFVAWMNRWLLGAPDRAVPALDEAGLELLDPALLACGPRQEVNMFSDACSEAARLRETRPVPDLGTVRAVAGLSGEIQAPEARLGEAARSWQHWVREVALNPEPGITLPATWLYPVDETRQREAVLYFDDRGRWTDLRKQGRAAQWAGFLGQDTAVRQLLTVDLRGWGDSTPADLPYDLAGWGGRDRWTAYVSAALGDGMMAMRIRDGLAAFAWLRARPGVEKIVVGGHGLGAVVALHVAVLAEDAAGIFCDAMPASIEMIVAEKENHWPPDVFIPEILRYYDLPALAGMFKGPVLIADPLNAQKLPLDRETAEKCYANALADNPECILQTGGGLSGYIADALRNN